MIRLSFRLDFSFSSLMNEDMSEDSCLPDCSGGAGDGEMVADSDLSVYLLISYGVANFRIIIKLF